MLTPEVQAKMAIWRAKETEGGLTVQDMKEIVEVLRGNRRLAAEQPASRRSTKGPSKSADDLLAELNGV